MQDHWNGSYRNQSYRIHLCQTGLLLLFWSRAQFLWKAVKNRDKLISQSWNNSLLHSHSGEWVTDSTQFIFCHFSQSSRLYMWVSKTCSMIEMRKPLQIVLYRLSNDRSWVSVISSRWPNDNSEQRMLLRSVFLIWWLLAHSNYQFP